MTQMDELIARVKRLHARGDNSLDVAVECALFRPGAAFKAIRPNAAETKVIYTDAAGNDVTCWADDWTILARREGTLTALRSRQEKQDG